jgi:phosphoribosylformimino-5-aminoimidazole carboxamide ribonucleotide (ProFAR) isomerase
MSESTFLPFQALTNCQTLEDCHKLLEYGIHRIIIADFAIDNPVDIKKIIKEYSDRRIIFYLPVKNDKVVFEHSNIELDLKEYVEYLQSLGANRVVFSQIESNPVIIPGDEILELLQKYFSKWTYMYDASNFVELQKLNLLVKYNMDSLIIGKSFYHTVFPCQKIWRISESRLDAGKDKILVD